MIAGFSIWQPEGEAADLRSGKIRLDDAAGTEILGTISGNRLTFEGNFDLGWHVLLTVETDKVYDRDINGIEQSQDINLPKESQSFPGFVIQDEFFYLPDGTPHILVGRTDFDLWKIFIEQGRDGILPIIRQRKEIGLRIGRILGMYRGGLGEFNPRGHLHTLEPFFQTLLEEGDCGEFCVFADTERQMPASAEQTIHFNTIDSIIRNFVNMLLEGGNEQEVHQNTAAALKWLRASGIGSHGSSDYKYGIAEPVWGYGSYHPDRTEDWPRKVGHNAMEAANHYDIPVWANEIKRPDEDLRHARNWLKKNGTPNPTEDQVREQVKKNIRDAAVNAALLCAGALYHSEQLKKSQILEGFELDCAREFVRGIHLPNPVFRTGIYTRSGSSGCPLKWQKDWSSRIHVRIQGNRAQCSVTQATPKFECIPINGWKLVKNIENSLIEVVR